MGRKIIRHVLRCVLGLLMALVMYGVAAWGLGRLPYHGVDVRDDLPRNITIYLVSNGVHNDIVMPMRHAVFDWHTLFHPQDTVRMNHAVYVGIGWGSRGFYLATPTWADLTPQTAFNALFGLDKSALHVTFYADAPQQGERVVAYRINEAEYRRVVQAILPSFVRDAHQRPRLIVGAHYASNDAFYEANGTYTGVYTCNTWVNERLKNSGLPSVYWTPFAQPLLAYYQSLPEK